MAAHIAHRGPDGEGYFVDGSAALGMRRLAIIDVQGGQQPKTSGHGRFHVVFNGEIYNYVNLRDGLRKLGRSFESDSDTEVVAQAYAEWGVASFRRLDGMFAIAIWDSQEKELILARDRYGEKPLYVWSRPEGVAFASEPRAFTALGRLPDLNSDTLTEYLHMGFIAAPRTIWRNIQKVKPGEYHIVRNGNLSCGATWAGDSDIPRKESPEDGEVLQILEEAVRSRLVSDVPVGVLLSGGIDSSLVTILAARHRSRLATFTVAFVGDPRNEAHFAAAVARLAGSDHHELPVTGSDALSVVPTLGHIYDEPFADSSAIPTLLVSRFAGSQLKVVLGGDGGDELFSGYRRYRQIAQLQRALRLSRTGRAIALSSRVRLPEKYRWAISTLGKDTAETYRNLVALNELQLVRSIQRSSGNINSITDDARTIFATKDDSVAPRLVDLHQYLPDDLLVKVDRASMSTGLEVRAPFLAPKLVEMAFELDRAAIGKPGEKAILRRILGGLGVPFAATRPKQGFSVPLHTWIAGPLNELVADNLTETALAQHGHFDHVAVCSAFHKAANGDRVASRAVWAVLMFQLWYTAWVCPGEAIPG